MKSKQVAAYMERHKSVLAEAQTALDRIQTTKGRIQEKGEIDSMLNFLQSLCCNVIDELDRESSKIKTGTRWRFLFKMTLYSQRPRRLLANAGAYLQLLLTASRVHPLSLQCSSPSTELEAQHSLGVEKVLHQMFVFSLRLLLLQHVWYLEKLTLLGCSITPSVSEAHFQEHFFSK